MYNKYIKINLPDIEIEIAEYAMANSFVIVILMWVYLYCFDTGL